MVNHVKPSALAATVRLSTTKIASPDSTQYVAIQPEQPVLIVLAAGKGTRFGQEPKCIQPVRGLALARHSINAFRRIQPSPVICVVGNRANEVMEALGKEPIYIRSDDPAGGTAFATFEAFSVPELETMNPIVIVTMGDRIITSRVFRRLLDTHKAGPREAQLTLLTAIRSPAEHHGKGRVVRNAHDNVTRIVEQRDIDLMSDASVRGELLGIAEVNCSLYAVRAVTLRNYLGRLEKDNAQAQYYITDIVQAIHRDGGDIRATRTTAADHDYDVLSIDVTRPKDLVLLEEVLDEQDAG